MTKKFIIKNILLLSFIFILNVCILLTMSSLLAIYDSQLLYIIIYKIFLFSYDFYESERLINSLLTTSITYYFIILLFFKIINRKNN